MPPRELSGTASPPLRSGDVKSGSVKNLSYLPASVREVGGRFNRAVCTLGERARVHGVSSATASSRVQISALTRSTLDFADFELSSATNLARKTARDRETMYRLQRYLQAHGKLHFFFVKISSEGHIGCLCVAYVLLRSQHSLSPSDWRPPAKKKNEHTETRRSTTRLRLRDSSEEDTEEDRYAEVSSRYVRACSPWPRLRGTLSALSRRELHMRLSRESSQSTPFPRFFSHLVDSLSLVCWQRARPRDLFLRPSCASVPFVGRFHCFRLCDTAAFQQKTGALCYVFSSEGGGCLRSSLPRRDNSGTGSARVAACTVAVLFIFSQTWQQCRGTGRTRANPSQRQHLTLSLF